ncbi:septum formation family protein [Micromonospora sp. SL4-19]|uniref:septum formation family protein n=1 Tax=Micromonospora sp. SL4-19 TaxID=3399129 RepID=UPI003A4D4A03
MRRWYGLAAVAAVMAVTVSGCGSLTGHEGDLTANWPPLRQAEQFAPKAGDCHVIANQSSYLTSYEPVDCGQPHLVETFHLGTFTGSLADRPAPPPVGSAAIRPAFDECDARVTAFVGGDWRGARLTIQVVPPSPNGWTGGARWFRCDVFEPNDTADGGNYRIRPYDQPIERTSSLRDVLKGASPLVYGCLNEDEWGNFQQITCTKAHEFEYVGSWKAPDGRYADADRDEDAIHAKCRTLVARYANVPVDGMLRYRTGTTYRLPSEEAWTRGDRGIRCFHWSGGKKLTRSIKGGGTKLLPVN